MTRIIAGFAGSLALAVPPAGTRPTSDRVREAIFSALAARDALHGAHALDLYAGSGALGLEAASRGADRVTLVERAKAAVLVCRRNTATVLASAPATRRPRIEVSSSSVLGFLTGSATRWDLVFIDPPYDLENPELEAVLEALVPRLSDDATIVVERSTRAAELAWPTGLTLERRRDYGDTALYWLSREHDSGDGAHPAAPFQPR